MPFGLCNDFENLPEQRSRTVQQNTTFGLRNRLNEDLRTSSHVSTAPRSLGLQPRISLFNGNLKDRDEVNGNMSVVSRTFGLVPDGPCSDAGNNERFHQDLSRNNYNGNGFVKSRPFGLQTRKEGGLFSQVVTNDNLRGNDHSEVTSYRNNNINITSVSRDVQSENLSGMNLHGNNERLNNDLRRNNYINSSFMARSNGFTSRNVTVNPGLLSERCPRLNQDFIQRSNFMSTSKTFGPAGRSLALGLQLQDSECYNEFNDDGFKRPFMSRMIRGRNSTLSSRLFNSENTSRHCKDLSNINGFNVSHISQRNADALSRSRFPINFRSNCTDNQSISQSVLSGASVKAQMMNLLENLHYSILNIGPHVTTEAVRLEFAKAKQQSVNYQLRHHEMMGGVTGTEQSLENISEMSFAPSIWNGDEATVITQSSKTICERFVSDSAGPTLNQPATSNTIDGGQMHLKSSREMLQTLISSREAVDRKKVNKSVLKGRKSVAAGESDEEENSELVFKKPKAPPKRRRNSKTTKSGTHRTVKSSETKASSKVVNLKQWYPIAVGSELAFCGIDEEGKTVRTDAIKKRVNNRKVELIDGIACHLIGSPSMMVSVLPKHIKASLKNGLTDRWRVLQKELLNCQTAERETKRMSRSPRVTSSPKKKTATTVKPKADVGKVKNLKVTSTPVGDVSEIHTRSGRTVKPPGMFWLVGDTGVHEVTSSSSRATPVAITRKTRHIEETPVKKMKKVVRNSPGGRAKAPGSPSRGKTKKAEDENTETKPTEAKKEREKEVKVDSSTEHSRRQYKSKQQGSKRKRDAVGDADVVQPKKSKLEKKTGMEVSEETIKGKKKKITTSPEPRPRKQSLVKKKKESVKKKAARNSSEGKKETREITESEEDFELKLDDIEIPEFGNVSGNPQLSRSQLRLTSMETPPLKYFSNNLKLLRSATPVRSPEWSISQRTESEVKQFQRRREEALRKKVKVDMKKTVIVEKTKSVQSKDVKRVMEWVAEKNVRSPQWNSKVLQYIIPSRKRMEQQADEEDEEELETDFL